MTYTKNREGYLIPSLSLPNQPNPYLNRYARLRLDYLEQNEPTLCDQLMLEGTLLTSCNRIGRVAQRMVDKTLHELMQTTQLPDRRTNPLGWTQMTNSLKSKRRKQSFRCCTKFNRIPRTGGERAIALRFCFA